MLRRRPVLLCALVGALAALAAVALVAAGADSPAARPAAHRSPCGPARARTIAQNAYARVYSPSVASPGNSLASGPLTACLRGRGRMVLLGSATGRQRVGPVALSGHVLAYGQTTMGIDTGATQLVVLDLASERTLHRQPAASAPTRPESFSSITDLVVSDAGVAVWLAQKSAIAQRPIWEVHRVGARGSELLDSGRTVMAGSLRRVGMTVTWRDAGRLRFASLS